tara:strand:- start:1014 stop:1877 length:864 start_codon:yes stop_codon:yes gene_type:complete
LTHSDDNSGQAVTELYQEALSGRSVFKSVREKVRNIYVELLSATRQISNVNNCVQFPYYHHVFSDEVIGFESQLQYLKNYGDFISIDAAISILNSNSEIEGRYFCLTFDDGLSCCYKYALPVLSKLNIPATFYVVTDFVGKTFGPNSSVTRKTFGYKGIETSIEFMGWQQCREAIGEGVTIGSHTVTHRRLSQLAKKQIIYELEHSKYEIEKNTKQICKHLCAPYGVPELDFDLIGHGELASKLGYKSFATGARGPNRYGQALMALQRDHLLANWSNKQLKYFFSRE